MSNSTDVETIFFDDHLKLVGLHTLAVEHRKSLDAILKAARAITGDREDGGHTDEAIWTDSVSVDTLLKRLEITVTPEKTELREYEPPQ